MVLAHRAPPPRLSCRLRVSLHLLLLSACRDGDKASFGRPGGWEDGRSRQRWGGSHVRPTGKHSNSHDARPVHLIITMINWIRTSRLSIKTRCQIAPFCRSTPGVGHTCALLVRNPLGDRECGRRLGDLLKGTIWHPVQPSHGPEPRLREWLNRQPFCPYPLAHAPCVSTSLERSRAFTLRATRCRTSTPATWAASRLNTRYREARI